MPADLYTKAVLTIIAGALVVIAWQGWLRPATAQGSGCGGSPFSACYVKLPTGAVLDVFVTNR